MSLVVLETRLCSNCQNHADHVCSGCGFDFYCNSACQLEHWREHAPLCGVKFIGDFDFWDSYRTLKDWTTERARRILNIPEEDKQDLFDLEKTERKQLKKRIEDIEDNAAFAVESVSHSFAFYIYYIFAQIVRVNIKLTELTDYIPDSRKYSDSYMDRFNPRQRKSIFRVGDMVYGEDVEFYVQRSLFRLTRDDKRVETLLSNFIIAVSRLSQQLFNNTLPERWAILKKSVLRREVQNLSNELDEKTIVFLLRTKYYRQKLIGKRPGFIRPRSPTKFKSDVDSEEVEDEDSEEIEEDEEVSRYEADEVTEEIRDALARKGNVLETWTKSYFQLAEFLHSLADREDLEASKAELKQLIGKTRLNASAIVGRYPYLYELATLSTIVVDEEGSEEEQ